ncbi:MAG: hypothetical protein LC541_00005 [Candidatus Thiodiazotropha sp.]|nr:hypothetical protein [Candidatus Thiodiazotropha sp.]MCM8881707.1 hypothetical protein [Candidatus Thiodiazotropha sp.]
MKQKIIQIIIAWFIPILGSSFIIFFALSEKEQTTKQKEETGVHSVLQGIPSALFRIITLSAFAGSVGGTSPDAGSDGDLSLFDGSDGGGGDGGGDG